MDPFPFGEVGNRTQGLLHTHHMQAAFNYPHKYLERLVYQSHFTDEEMRLNTIKQRQLVHNGHGSQSVSTLALSNLQLLLHSE